MDASRHLARLRSRVSLVCILLPVIALGVLGGSSAQAVTGPSCAAGAANVTPSCFEGGDGDLAAVGPFTDWDTTGAEKVPLPDLVGAGDDEFQPGSSGQELVPDLWDIVLSAGNVVPGKSDIDNAVIATESVPSLTLGQPANVFLYAALQTREDSGNTNVNVELNQLGTTWVNSVGETIPERSPGDVLLTFDGQNGTFAVGICKWVGPREGEQNPQDDRGWHQIDPVTGAATAVKISGSQNCTPMPATIAKGASSPVALDNSSGGLPGFPAVIAANTFAELSINLSAALTGTDGNACFSFGSAWIHTRVSDTVSSTQNDYVDPVAIPPTANCGVSVDKKVSVDPAGAAPPFTDANVASATQTQHYELRVRNVGVVPLTIASADIDDPGCSGLSAAPVRKEDTNGADDTPGTFDPDDVWTWTCNQTPAGGAFAPGGSYTNTVTVVAHFGAFTTPTATDSATTRFKAAPSLSTSAATAPLGSAVTDDATLSGGQAPTGTITFRLYGPNDPTCSGNPVATVATAVNGNGTYTSPPVTPAEPGAHRWIATYEGDANNDAVAGACNDPGETSVVTDPRLAIVKSGPATASPGQDVTFTFAVTNPGDVPLVSVTVTDDRCTAFSPDVLKQRDGGSDPSPTTLDPGDVWTFSCTMTMPEGDQVVNTGTANAKTLDDDPIGPAQSTHVTTLIRPAVPPPAAPAAPPPAPAAAPPAPPAAVVLGAAVESGTARLRGPRRCVARAFRARVTGRKIAAVTFFVDGRRVRTVRAAKGRTVFSVRIDPRRQSDRLHRVTARVRFRVATGTRTRTLSLTYQRCPRAAAKPLFTG